MSRRRGYTNRCWIDTTITVGNSHSTREIKLPKWMGYDDLERDCHYEVELSRDGHHFSGVGTLQKNAHTNNNNYKFVYDLRNKNENGIHFFRIKQVYSNGYTRFSDIRSVELKSLELPKFNFYPNPSNGIVGIKFDDIFGGKLFIQIINMQGQTIVIKEIFVNGDSNCRIAALQGGSIG